MNERRKQKILAVVQQRLTGLRVVLEDIHDPHNAAAILRTCDALGIQTVYFIFDKETPYNPKKIGKATSSSANKWLDFRVFNSAAQCMSALKKNGYTIIATALTKQAEALPTAVFNEKRIALLVGNEKEGLSQYAIAHADRTITIPMRGFVQSLNVSVATAIVLWEITKQRSSMSFKTPYKEQEKLLKDVLARAAK